VDHLFVFGEQGQIKDFPGNYSDYRKWIIKMEKESDPIEKTDKIVKTKLLKEYVRKLSFNEKKELEKLEKDIAILDEEKRMIETAMNSGNCSPNELVDMSYRHAEIIQLLNAKESRWVELGEIEN
jgi:ATP-binding cassette subfamily F protein uup